MLRIVFVVDSLFELGPFWQLKFLLKSLAQQNDLDLHVVSLNDESNSNHNDAGLAKFHTLAANRRPLNRLIELRKCVAELSPDIVHAWGDPVHTITKWVTSGINCRRIFSHFEHHQDGSLANFCNRTSDEHVYSHGTLNADGENSNVIGNPAPDSTFVRETSRARLLTLAGLENENVFLAGTVADHQPRFRLKDLVWAIDLLCCVRQDIHLLIFAEGDPRTLIRFIDKTEARENIHLISPELARTSDIAGLDFYWHSHRQTPNPLPMMTAMKSGVPVISVLDNETEDLILPLQSALATNLGARDEFARWTKYLIEQRKSVQQLTKQANLHVEKLFTNSQIVWAYLELYRK